MLRMGEMLTPTDWAWIEAITLGYLARLPHTVTSMVMVIELYKRWHSEMVMFHLLIGEMTMTLEDVYHIFKLPVRGTPVMVTKEMMIEVVV